MLALVAAILLQQAAPAGDGRVVWSAPPVETPGQAPPPPIPDSARADPYGYERAQCSPLIRSETETLAACQSRVRAALAAHLGDALPVGMAGRTAADDCRREAAGDRHALQCGAPVRAAGAVAVMEERVCETRPEARDGGGVVWREACRPESRRGERDEGLTLRWGDRD